MTATVVDITSRARNREPACGCPRHRLEALVARSLAQLAGMEDELLIERTVLERLVDDLVSTVQSALASSERAEP